MVRLNNEFVAKTSIELGPASQVTISHSTSSPGQFHVTVKLEKPVMVKRFGGEVQVLCSCRGFQNHRKCWHVAHPLMADDEEEEEEVEDG
jgi:hypothetical protein